MPLPSSMQAWAASSKWVAYLFNDPMCFTISCNSDWKFGNDVFFSVISCLVYEWIKKTLESLKGYASYLLGSTKSVRKLVVVHLSTCCNFYINNPLVLISSAFFVSSPTLFISDPTLFYRNCFFTRIILSFTIWSMH